MSRNPHAPRRALIVLGATLATLLTLTGCQGIPRAGSVHQGLSDLSQSQQEVQYRPDRPMPDATQEEILRGFLQAASSATDDYDIARQFLTSDYRGQWDPNMQVTIDEGGRTVTSQGEDTMSLKLQGVALINENGVLTQTQPGESTQVPFEFEEENGEWRIASAPNGVILDRATFLDVWSLHPIFFLTTKGGLSADNRWFLNRATMSTHIVTQLLTGPSETQHVLTSAFPAGTRLASDAVIIDGGTARIDLSSDFDQISDDELDLVGQQLAASLYSVPGVSHFVVSVDNVDVLAEDVAAPTVATSDTVDSGLTVGALLDGEFGYLSSSGFTEQDVLSSQMPPGKIDALTLSRASDQAAALTKDGVTWIDESGSLLIDDRTDLIAPTIDDSGYVWLTTRTPKDTFTVWHPTRDHAAIAVPDTVAEGTLTAARISPDGNRIAFAMTEGKGEETRTKIVVHSIVRDDAGTPTELIGSDSPLTMWAEGSAIDLDWIDTQRFGVVTSDDSDSTLFTITGPGLFSESRAGLSGVVSVRSGGRLPLTYLLTSKGNVASPQGTAGWQEYATDIDVLAKRG